MLGHIVLEKLYGKDIFEVFDITRKKNNRLNNFECDVTNLNSLFKIIKDINPDYIINCIGVLIKGSIQDPSNAILINALLPHKLAQFSKAINAKFIHISTDCVFDGSKGSYIETILERQFRNLFEKASRSLTFSLLPIRHIHKD